MSYKALTYIVLGEKTVSPGEMISEDDLEAANQTDEDIAALIEGGSISEDMDAPIHESHQAPEIEAPEGTTHIQADDGGSGKS